MIYDNEINEIINNRYIRYRSEATLKAQLNIEQAEKSPEYNAICDRLRGYSFEIAKAEAEGDTIKCDKLKEERLLLQKQKQAVLKKIGLSEDSLLPNYRCKACGDTGYIGGIACKCRYREMNDVILKDLGIKDNSLPRFSDSALDKNSPLNCIYKIAKDYIEKFDSTTKKNLIFTGKSGTGKTFLTDAIVSELMDRDRIAVFINAYDLLRVIGGKSKNNPSNQYIYDLLINCDMLAIDDLGTEPSNDAFLYGLNLIINQRYTKQGAFIITTNLTLTELNQRYGDRIFSRITGKNSVVIPFEGEDLRKNL